MTFSLHGGATWDNAGLWVEFIPQAAGQGGTVRQLMQQTCWIISPGGLRFARSKTFGDLAVGSSAQ
jgi:hypothetical protein